MSANHPPRPSSRNRAKHTPPQPTTPLRPSSRSSLRSSRHRSRSGASPTPFYGSSGSASGNPHLSGGGGRGSSNSVGPYNIPAINSLEPQFAELADSMADLEANFMHLQLLHESLGRFGECFASFLYGLEVRAFCVDFPEAPIKESLKRAKYLNPHTTSSHDHENPSNRHEDMMLNETTFMTTDTSFIENPAPSTQSSSTRGKYMGEPTPVTPGPVSRRGGGAGRGGSSMTRGGPSGPGSGIARGNVARGRAGASSGIARGTGRGRGSASGLPRGAASGRGAGRGMR